MVDLLLIAAGIAVVLGIVIVVQHSRLAENKGERWRLEQERDRALKGKTTAQNQTKALQTRCRLLIGQLDNSISHTGQALEVARDIAHVRQQLQELTDFVVFPLDTGSGEHRKALPEQAHRVIAAPPVARPAVADADPYDQDADPYAAEDSAPPMAPPGPWPVVHANPYSDPNVVPHRHAEHPVKARSHPYQNDLPYGSTVSISGGTYHYTTTDKER